VAIITACEGCGRSQSDHSPGGRSPEPPPPAASVDSLREPTAHDAVLVLRTYYEAINAKRYRDAYACWARQGEASRQSFEQFEAGFARTDSVRVEVGRPSDMDAAAGSRYITVPVHIVAHSGGPAETFAGTYTLRRSVVDGATYEQRHWRIEMADIRKSR
jgi:hypothetical protein